MRKRLALLGLLVSGVLCGSAAEEPPKPTVTPVAIDWRKDPKTHRVAAAYMRAGFEGADMPFTLAKPKLIPVTEVDGFIREFAASDTFVFVCEYTWQGNTAVTNKDTCAPYEPPTP